MKILRGCGIPILVLLLVIVVLVLVPTLPPAAWLYQHNYYFQGLVDAMHGK